MENPKRTAEEEALRATVKLYNELIFEAFPTLKDPEGLDTSTILKFIERRIEGPTPSNFRRYVTARLRSLVQQGTLEKVPYGLYKLKAGEPLSRTKTPLPEQRDSRPTQVSVTTTFNQSHL